MVLKMLLFFWAIQKKHSEIRKHCGFFSALMYHCQPMRSCPVTYAGGKSKYFSCSVRINWHWAATRYVLYRESGSTGFDVTGTLYMCYRNWWILFFWKLILLDQWHYLAGTVSIFVSMRKKKQEFWLIYNYKKYFFT